jgi:hypothetical protein
MAYNFLTVALPFLDVELEHAWLLGGWGFLQQEIVQEHGWGIISVGADFLGVEQQQEGRNASLAPF